jgi:tetratricopeptide (TPR) repeat protein
MNIFLNEDIRRVIPRWRDYRTTVILGELSPSRSIGVTIKQPAPDSLEERIRDWEANKTTSFASDLVGTAFVMGKYDKAIDAARFLLSKECNASKTAKEIARKVLGLDEQSIPTAVGSDVCRPETTATHVQLHNLRNLLSHDPRNSIAWAELSLLYAILGTYRKATWAMDVSLALSPSNRYILRAAARLHIHLKDYEQAHYLLLHAQSIRSDPWILASEISVASIMERTSKFVNLAIKMLESKNYPPFHTTELASAIGTLELSAGNRKYARKLFQQALIKPNDNTLAQACWASIRLKAFSLNETYYEQVPLTCEARYIAFSQAKEWKRAIDETWCWLSDQPFSARPAVQGSYIAAIAIEDFVESARIAECGLVANPTHPSLLNNFAFALVNQKNQIDKAEEVFSRINLANLDSHMKIVWNATKGLIMYRKGDPNEGRNYYQTAIQMASDLKDKDRRARAAIYLAREEKLCKSPLAETAMTFAREASEGLADPEIDILLARVGQQS